MPDIVVPAWLLQRFQTLNQEAHQDEQLYYEMVNTLLTTYFPPRSGFMVTPNIRIPRLSNVLGAVTADLLDPYNYAVSTDSLRNERSMTFLVSLGSPRPDGDVHFLVCAVGRMGNVASDSTTMVTDYVDWARRYQSQLTQNDVHMAMHVLLIRGATTEVYRLDLDGSVVVSFHETMGTEMREILQALNQQHAVV